jgi:hypothetical protein
MQSFLTPEIGVTYNYLRFNKELRETEGGTPPLSTWCIKLSFYKISACIESKNHIARHKANVFKLCHDHAVNVYKRSYSAASCILSIGNASG